MKKEYKDLRDSDQKVVRSLLVNAARRYRNWVETQGTDGAWIESLGSRFGAISPDELEIVLAKQPLLLSEDERRRGIILEPIASKPTTVCPILFLTFDFTKDVPEIQVAVMLCAADAIGQSIALRFEMPEGAQTNDAKGGHGEHNFYHAQFTRELRAGRRLEIPRPHSNCEKCGCPLPEQDHLAWLTLSQPSFALDARSPVSLVACVLITLYGTRTFQRNYAPEVEGLKEHLDQMLCANPGYSEILRSGGKRVDTGGRWLIHPQLTISQS